MIFSCVWVKRDMFFIILIFGVSMSEAVFSLFLANSTRGVWFFFFELFWCVANLMLMSNADTSHMLMLMSRSPSDGSGTPRASPAKLRKKSTIRDAIEKNCIPHAFTRFDNCIVELLKALHFGINGVAFNKYVMNALTRKGSKHRKVVLLLDSSEFVAGVNRVESLCGDMRHLPTHIDMLKDQVQELGKET